MRVVSCRNVDLSFLSSANVVDINDVGEIIDWRRKSLFKKQLPDDLIPVVCSGEGDCLFCSLSLLLYGSEEHSKDLRFACVQYALSHFDHYLQMLTTELTTLENALQFCTTVISDERVITSLTDHTNIRNMLKETLQAEIRSTSKIGCYSGLLQILFLSGTTNYAIKQHCEVERDGYSTTLHPCGCSDQPILGTAHVMWVKNNPNSPLNHIIPLFNKGTYDNCMPVGGTWDTNYTTIKSVLNSDVKKPLQHPGNKELVKNCVQFGICLFCIKCDRFSANHLCMVQCETCSRWFHCFCVGVHIDHFDNGESFSCCTSPKNDFLVIASNKTKLYFSDVQTLYPNKGISDAVIDFFVRNLLSKEAQLMTASALGYTAIVQAIKNKSDIKKSFRSANGTFNVNQHMQLFPCCITHIWHWILVAVYLPKEQIAFVMDSLSSVLQPYSVKAVQNICAFLQCWDCNVSLKPVAYKVSMQEGVECGAHVMHYIQTIVEMKTPGDYLMQYSDVLSTLPAVDSKFLRKRVLAKLYELSEATARKSRTKIRQNCLSDKKNNKEGELLLVVEKADLSGLKVVCCNGKGKGVTTTRPYVEGEFVCEYEGEIIPIAEARRREKCYIEKTKKNEKYKGYMFFFTYKSKKYCIDATEGLGVGRMINHSKTKPNIIPRLHDIKGKSRIFFFTIRDIDRGEEVLYNYGDNAQSSVHVQKSQVAGQLLTIN